MPHVEIYCFSGRTDEQKTLCAEKVWDAHITPDEPYLYKKPGYTCE